MFSIDVVVPTHKIKIAFFVFFLCFTRSLTNETPWNHTKYNLPKVFRIGVATSAYQVEGAWDEDGKGESIWDRYLQTHPELFAPGPNGTDACDSYHNYKRDVQMLREMGIDFYKFSISWSRVLPTGFADNVNTKGLEYYENLAKELYKYNIEVMATMYHNDLPQALQDLGGWANPDIVQWFEDYARLLFEHIPFVKYWIPINDPSVCFQMYDSRAKMAPGLDSKGVDDYLCVKHMLLAHAKVYRMFREEFQSNISISSVGMTLTMNWGDALNWNTSDEGLLEARKIFQAFTIDLYLNPLYAAGFPKLVQQIVARNSRLEGLEESRLPTFTNEEIKLMRNAIDFVGLNHYTTYFVELPGAGKVPSYPQFPIDMKVKVTQYKKWKKSKTPGLASVAYGLHRICDYLNQRFARPPLILTEFGWSTDAGRNDTERVAVMFEYLKSLILALIDNTDFRGLTIWSLMDNIQWTAGTTQRFGLYQVDFSSPSKIRTPRLSAHYVRVLAETHFIKESWEPYNQDLSLGISPRKAVYRPAEY